MFSNKTLIWRLCEIILPAGLKWGNTLHWKSKISKNDNIKSCSPFSIFFNEKIEKNSFNLLTLKVRIVLLSTFHNFFTFVTKTFANLATYSRKQESYNGTIIFEFDIMKNSSPINLNLCQTWLFHLLFGCLFCFDLLWTELRVLWVQQKRSAILVLTWQKCEY